ncbi:hypothetical protein [Bifidobacterium bifidum]|uniref:hypothetical protein n=1 Tax=Bifidobacterium bifidum TaxID=1681 RepID=UPI0012D94C87|nr:hypothetical protein [Bifidobacterium bifidum]
MQSGRVAPVDNSRKEERKRRGKKGEREGKKGRERGKGGRRKEERKKGRKEKRKKKSLDHGVKGLRAAYFMRLRRTY